MCRACGFLQVLRCTQAQLGIAGKQLMAGQCRVDQPAQTVVQAQGFGLAVYRELTLLQAVDQFDAGRGGLRGPAFEQLSLL